MLRFLFSLNIIGHHECEILGRGLEAAESETRWKECKKNPGHKKFISTTDFINNNLPRVKTVKNREWLRAVINLTVRLRVNWTNQMIINFMDSEEVIDFALELALSTMFISPCPTSLVHVVDAMGR